VTLTTGPGSGISGSSPRASSRRISPLDESRLSYFLSTIELHLGTNPGLSRWRKRLFLATAGLTADAAEYFQLPRDRTVIMGSRVEL
jgi:KUP system potassium uptake protein